MEPGNHRDLGKVAAVGRRVKAVSFSVTGDTDNIKSNHNVSVRKSFVAKSDKPSNTAERTHADDTQENICNNRLCTRVARFRVCHGSRSVDSKDFQAVMRSRRPCSGKLCHEQVSCSSKHGNSSAMCSTINTSAIDYSNVNYASASSGKSATGRERTWTHDQYLNRCVRSTETCQQRQSPHVFGVAALCGMECPSTTTGKDGSSGGFDAQNSREPAVDAAPADSSSSENPAVTPCPSPFAVKDGVATAGRRNSFIKHTSLTTAAVVTPRTETEQVTLKHGLLRHSATIVHQPQQRVAPRAHGAVERNERTPSATDSLERVKTSLRRPPAEAYIPGSAAAPEDERADVIVTSPSATATVNRHSLEHRLGGEVCSDHHININSVSSEISPLILYDDGEEGESAAPATSLLQHFLQHQKQKRSSFSECLRRRCNNATGFSKAVFRRGSVSSQRKGRSPSLTQPQSPHQHVSVVEQSGTMTRARVSMEAQREEPHLSKKSVVAVLSPSHQSRRAGRDSRTSMSIRGSQDRTTGGVQEGGTRWDEFAYGENYLLSRYSDHSYSSKNSVGSNSRCGNSGGSAKHMGVHVFQRLHREDLRRVDVVAAADEAEAPAAGVCGYVSNGRLSLKSAAAPEEEKSRRILSRGAQSERQRSDRVPQQQAELSQPLYNMKAPSKKEGQKLAARKNGLQWSSSPLSRYTSLPHKPAARSSGEKDHSTEKGTPVQQVIDYASRRGDTQSFPFSVSHSNGSYRTPAGLEGGGSKQVRRKGLEEQQRGVAGGFGSMEHPETPLSIVRGTSAGATELSNLRHPVCTAAIVSDKNAVAPRPYVETPLKFSPVAADREVERAWTTLAASSGAGKKCSHAAADSAAGADVSAAVDSIAQQPCERGSDTSRGAVFSTPQTDASFVLRAQERRTEAETSPRTMQAKSPSPTVAHGEGAGEGDTYDVSAARKQKLPFLSWLGWGKRQQKKEPEISSSALHFGYLEKATVQVANAAGELPQPNTSLLLPLREQRARRLRTHVIIEIRDGLHRILEVQVAEVLRMLEQQCEADEQEQLLYLEKRRRRQRAARSRERLQKHRSDLTTTGSDNDSCCSSRKEGGEEHSTSESSNRSENGNERTKGCSGPEKGHGMQKQSRSITKRTSTNRRRCTSSSFSHDCYQQYEIQPNVPEGSGESSNSFLSTRRKQSSSRNHPLEWSSQIDNSSTLSSDSDGHISHIRGKPRTTLSAAATTLHENENTTRSRRRRKLLSGEQEEVDRSVGRTSARETAMLLSQKLPPSADVSEEETLAKGQIGKKQLGSHTQITSSRRCQVTDASLHAFGNGDVQKALVIGSSKSGLEDKNVSVPLDTTATGGMFLANAGSRSNNVRYNEQHQQPLKGSYKKSNKVNETASQPSAEEDGRAHTKRRSNTNEAVCCTAPRCCGGASRTLSSMSMSSNNSNRRTRGNNSSNATREASSSKKIDTLSADKLISSENYDRVSCSREETDGTGHLQAEGVRLPLKSRVNLTPGELLVRGSRKEESTERKENSSFSTTCCCRSCPCCKQKTSLHTPASTERWYNTGYCCCCCRRCSCCCSRHVSSRRQVIKNRRHRSRIHTPLSRTSSVTSLSTAIERQHRLLELLQQQQEEQQKHQQWQRQQTGTRKRKGGPDTGRLTYRDCRQAFTDVHPIPSIEVRRHVVLVCLPPVTCFVLWDRVFLLMTDDLEPDHLISQLSKLTRHYAALERKTEAAELGGGGGRQGEGSTNSLRRSRQVYAREVSEKTIQQQLQQRSLEHHNDHRHDQHHPSDETLASLHPSYGKKKTRQELPRNSAATSHTPPGSFPLSYKERRSLQEHINHDNTYLLQHPGDKRRQLNQRRYQQHPFKIQRKSLRQSQHEGETNDHSPLLKLHQRNQFRTCYSSDGAPEALLQDVEEAAASANEDVASSTPVETVHCFKEFGTPHVTCYKRQPFSYPFAGDQTRVVLRDHDDIMDERYQHDEPMLASGSVDTAVGHRNKYISQTHNFISHSQEADIEYDRPDAQLHDDDDKWKFRHRDNSPVFYEEGRKINKLTGRSLCAATEEESHSGVREDLQQAGLAGDNRLSTSAESQQLKEDIGEKTLLPDKVGTDNENGIYRDIALQTQMPSRLRTKLLFGAIMPKEVIPSSLSSSSSFSPSYEYNEQPETQAPGGQEHQELLLDTANAAHVSLSTIHAPSEAQPLCIQEAAPDVSATDIPESDPCLGSQHNREQESSTKCLRSRQLFPPQQQHQAGVQQKIQSPHSPIEECLHQHTQEEGQEHRQQKKKTFLFSEESQIVSSVKQWNGATHCSTNCYECTISSGNRISTDRDQSIDRISSHIHGDIVEEFPEGGANRNDISERVRESAKRISSTAGNSGVKESFSHAVGGDTEDFPRVGSRFNVIFFDVHGTANPHIDRGTHRMFPHIDDGIYNNIHLHKDRNAGKVNTRPDVSANNQESLTPVDGGDSRTFTHVNSHVFHNIPAYIHGCSANEISSPVEDNAENHKMFLHLDTGADKIGSNVDASAKTIPSSLHGGVSKGSSHIDGGVVDKKSLMYLGDDGRRISTCVNGGDVTKKRLTSHTVATEDSATTTSDSDTSYSDKVLYERTTSSSFSELTRCGRLPRSPEHKRQTSSGKRSMPFEFAALECIFFAAFQQLNFDIVYLEKKFAETHQRAAKKAEASSILMEGLHSLKEPVAVYEDRVTAFDKAFDELLSNNVDLHRMELTRLHHNPGLYDYDPHKDEVDPELEILLEYFDQEMDQFKGRVRHLKEGIDNTERLISLRLALMRNRLIQWELAAAVVAAGIAIGTCISGIFGMNLSNGYEDGKEHSHQMFSIISAVIAILAGGSVAVVLYLIRTIVL